MFNYFILIFLLTFLFMFLDYLLSFKFKKNYYIIHSIINLIIVVLTLPDVISLYTNIYSVLYPSLSFYGSLIIYSLHFYHIIWYFSHLRFDDWLHHILMIFIVLPIGNYQGSVNILGHGLFYTTGLPGMIDYALLFLVRNNVINYMIEKKVNFYLNLCIRCPGCIIHGFISFYYIISNFTLNFLLLGGISGLLVVWNGIYFMQQVVGNYYELEYKKKLKN